MPGDGRLDTAAVVTLETRKQPVTFLLERSALSRRHRGPTAELDSARILGNAVHAELVMQMGAGGETGRTDIPDRLALFDSDTCSNVAGEPAQVAIPSGDTVQVPQLDQVAVAARVSGAKNNAIARCHHRSPGRRGVIGPFVAASETEHWVKPPSREVGGDTAKFNGRPEECPPQ